MLFGIAVETGVVLVVYLHEALEQKLRSGKTLTNADVEAAAIEGARAALKAKAHDRMRGSRQPGSDSVGIRHRVGGD